MLRSALPASTRARRAPGLVRACVAACLLLASLPALAAPDGAPLFTATPLAIDFGTVNVGQTSTQAEVVITNTSAGSLGPLTIFGGGTGAPFNASQNCQGITLAAGATCSVFVDFAPTQIGDANAVSSFTLSPSANANDGVPFSVTLSGRGENPLVASATSIDFGAQAIGSTTQSSVQFTNTGTQPFGPLTIAGGGLSGAFAVSQNCQGTTLAAGASCSVVVDFEPMAAGPVAAVSEFSIGPTGLNSAWKPFSIALQGSGVPVLSVSPLAIDFGTVAVGSTATQSVTVTNTGVAPFGPLTIFGGEPATPQYSATQACQGVTLPPGGTCTITIAFAPTANGTAVDTAIFALGPTANEADATRFSVALSGIGTGGVTTPPALPPVRVPATSPLALLLLAGAMMLLMALRRR